MPDSIEETLAAAGASKRLVRQFEFILELDRLKNVLRQSPLLDRSRRENDAEHSWHLAMAAVVLAEYASPDVNIGRVIRMLLVHDLVEIDAGDTFLYDDLAAQDKAIRERTAADRIFGLLPNDLAHDLRSIWEEFEARETADAKFAAGLDRLQPLLQNYFTGGGTWRHANVTLEKVLARKSVIADASQVLWGVAKGLIQDGASRGYVASEIVSTGRTF